MTARAYERLETCCGRRYPAAGRGVAGRHNRNRPGVGRARFARGRVSGTGRRAGNGRAQSVLGRLDFDDGDHLQHRPTGASAGRDLLLTDYAPRRRSRSTGPPRWSGTAPASPAVTVTAGRKVARLDDDVLDLDAVDETHLTGEAAAGVAAPGPTGWMGRDTVATIQADQDRIIRDDLNGILVVEGGPGTGKTVVEAAPGRVPALHVPQAAGAARILVIGPNGTFMRHIDQVLALLSLGENDASCSRRSARCTPVSTPARRRHRRPPASRAVPGWPGSSRRPSPTWSRCRQDHADQGSSDDVRLTPSVPEAWRPGAWRRPGDRRAAPAQQGLHVHRGHAGRADPAGGTPGSSAAEA